MRLSTAQRAGWVCGLLLWCRLVHAAPAPSIDGTSFLADDAAVLEAAPDVARRVLDTFDHRGLPFAVVDKKAAMLFVYRADGRLAGVTPALLGQTTGDRATPGVGDRAQRGRLGTDDRTTPAGRFSSEPGRNLTGEPVVWIDYAAALAIHRLRPGSIRARRAQRLESTIARDRRISAGCVVVPVAFYDNVVQPILGRGRGVVYVMPEERATPEPWPESIARAL